MPIASAGQVSGRVQACFEIKSAQLPLVALVLRTSDWDELARDFCSQFGPQGESADFFDHDALVIDFSHLPADAPVPDMAPLLTMLRTCRLTPVAVRGASAQWTEAARALGLADAPAEVVRVRPDPVAAAPIEPVRAPKVVEVVHEVVRDVVHEVPGPATLVVDKTLRSGQKIYARGADLVVLAMVNQGAEVVADGNIHVYAPLRGKAMAGASGNTQARIFSLCLEPELISIAGVYRTSENPLPPAIHGKAAQVRLSNDGHDKLLFEALNS